VLDRAFYDSAEAALRDRLQGYLYAIIAGSDINSRGMMSFPEALAEPRFATPDSGLYAEISSHDGKQTWRSPSSVGLDIPYPENLPRGITRFEEVITPSGMRLFSYSSGLSWVVRRREVGFTFSVSESMESFYRQIASFRRSLWGWLGGVTVLLLAVQGTILRWGLAPLRRLAENVRAIEQGKATHLEGRYPGELRGLSNNLNALIRSEREHLDRYRKTLADLAHSVKTPLAVLQGEVENPRSIEALRTTLAEQVDRIRQLVDYQLQKAAASGRMTLAAPISVAETVQRIVASLGKAYAERNVVCKVDVAPEILFPGDKGDLLELIGNLAENAFKYCNTQVHISAAVQSGKDRSRTLRIVLDDDGPGIPDDMVRAVLQRGVRADETVKGHGIGLAVVKDIVDLYEGKLLISASERLGGARVVVSIPLAR
jgi:two-component system sensor histidine kinase PhoQ